jgi:hypothetical protein
MGNAMGMGMGRLLGLPLPYLTVHDNLNILLLGSMQELLGTVCSVLHHAGALHAYAMHAAWAPMCSAQRPAAADLTTLQSTCGCYQPAMCDRHAKWRLLRASSWHDTVAAALNAALLTTWSLYNARTRTHHDGLYSWGCSWLVYNYIWIFF